jgi:hypothetical protein
MSSLIFINCYAYIDVVIHCLKYLIINLNSYYSHDHCAVYVDSMRKRTASLGKKNWPGKFMRSPQVKTPRYKLWTADVA